MNKIKLPKPQVQSQKIRFGSITLNETISDKSRKNSSQSDVLKRLDKAVKSEVFITIADGHSNSAS